MIKPSLTNLASPSSVWFTIASFDVYALNFDMLNDVNLIKFESMTLADGNEEKNSSLRIRVSMETLIRLNSINNKKSKLNVDSNKIFIFQFKFILLSTVTVKFHYTHWLWLFWSEIDNQEIFQCYNVLFHVSQFFMKFFSNIASAYLIKDTETSTFV